MKILFFLGSKKISYSYSQKPNVDTRFHVTTDPQVCRILLTIASGALSLILPTNTVIMGPSCVITGAVIIGGFIYICGLEFIVGGGARKFGLGGGCII